MSHDTAGAESTTWGPSRELLLRVVSAAALAAIALFGALFGGWAAVFVVAVVVIVVHVEWANLTERSSWPTAIFTGDIVLAIALFAIGLHFIGLIVAALAMVVSFVGGGRWRPLGVLYVALLGFGVLGLRLSPTEGLTSILFVLAVVWATDTGAFFAGRTIGGAKLWPQISPNKTWAGAIGGLVAGVIAGLIVLALTGLPISSPLVLVSALMSLASEAGDLFESFVKRVFGAKDSGWLVPGHGGLMDRVDSLTFAAALAALIGWIHAGANVGQGLLTW